MSSKVDGWIVSPRKSRKKSACFSSTTTRTPARASRNPSIIPAGPPPAMQHCVLIVASAMPTWLRRAWYARLHDGKTRKSGLAFRPGRSRRNLRLQPVLGWSLPLDERAAAQIAQRLADLSLRVHDDRPVPGDRLAQRPARDQKEAHALVARLDADLVAGAEDDERPVADPVAHQHLVAIDLSFAQHAGGFRRVGECR